MSLVLSGLKRAESLTVLTATQLALIPPEYPFLARDTVIPYKSVLNLYFAQNRHRNHKRFSGTILQVLMSDIGQAHLGLLCPLRMPVLSSGTL